MTKDLFFDTDCLSAFLWVGETNILHKLYGGKIIVPEPVYSELSNPSIPHIKKRTDAMIDNKDISVKTINTDTEEYELYTELVREEKGKKVLDAERRVELLLRKYIMVFLQVTIIKILLRILKNINYDT